MSLESKIREKAKIISELWEETPYEKTDEILEFIESKLVRLDDVLAIVNTAAGELAELLKNHPTLNWTRFASSTQEIHEYYKKIEKKVAELRGT